MVGALAVGLSQFLQQAVVVGTIGVLGGTVLLWMGWGIVQTARAGALEMAQGAGGSKPSGTSLIRTGFVITVSNPYWLLWWATVGAAYYVAFSRFGPMALVVLFLVGHVALDLGWTTFLALVVGAGRGRIPVRAYQIVLGICGAFVMVMSGYFVYSGIRHLAR
jgi:threonine/homoserine/homoserine lactone efflux protein